MDCFEFEDINEVEFHGFSRNEVDSISVEVFAAKTGMTARLDSVTSGAASQGMADSNEFTLYLSDHVSKEREYRFTLHRTGKVYGLSDFETIRLECNCPSDKYDYLNGYFVDGRKINGSRIVIER